MKDVIFEFLTENISYGIYLIIISIILSLLFYIYKKEKLFLYFSFFSKRKSALEEHILIQELNDCIINKIPNLNISVSMKNLLITKFEVWRDVFLLIAENKKLKEFSNPKLYKYLSKKISKTLKDCEMKLKNEDIPHEMRDKFLQRHHKRTSVLLKDLNYIIYNDFYYDNTLKMSIYFDSCIPSFYLAISHAIEIDKELQKNNTKES